jgi:hypothetical protein
VSGLVRGLGALSLVVAAALPSFAQEASTEDSRARTRTQRAGAYAGNLGRFGGAIVAAEAGRAAIEGDSDAVGDALRAPTSPEFLAGLAIFDGALRTGNAVTSRLPSAGQLGNALKQNLVLAGALTVTSAIEVDLNGFSYRDLVRGDFSSLRGARVGLRDVDAQSLGITMGAFAAAQAIWNGAKRIARPFAAAVGRRLARTAVLKAGLAVAPVPGTRVAALLLTGVEVALAVGDLAGLLMTAQAIDEPLQAANERRRRGGAVRDAERRAATSAGGSSRERLQGALAGLRDARAHQRAEAYTRATRQDLALVRRLRDRGAEGAVFDELADRALADYGPGLALPAFSALLLEQLPHEVAAGRLTPAALERHRARVLQAQAEAAEARDASYRAEDAAYARLLSRARSEAARAAIQAAREEVALEAEIERDDLRARLQPVAQTQAGQTQAGQTQAGQTVAGQTPAEAEPTRPLQGGITEALRGEELQSDITQPIR